MGLKSQDRSRSLEFGTESCVVFVSVLLPDEVIGLESRSRLMHRAVEASSKVNARICVVAIINTLGSGRGRVL